jgi:hypothetical protein
VSLLTVDIVLGLPAVRRDLAISSSALLADRMRMQGHPSAFQLGVPVPGDLDGHVCEPHVSLFMLQVAESEIGGVLDAVWGVTEESPAVLAEGDDYRYNPYGAPELYYRKSPEWVALQRAVVAAVEPLRRGRLRDTDPSGTRLVELMHRLRQEEPGSHQLRQLVRYGYDEIADDQSDRFNPHVTLAWPEDTFRVDLSGLPAAAEFSGPLTDLAIFGMRQNGTCTKRYGGFPLAGGDLFASDGHGRGQNG